MAPSKNKNPDVLSLRLERTDLVKFLEESRKKKEFTDVQLQIGDKLFDAHRNVLSFESPVLKAMISDQWSTSKICPISGEYVDPSIVEELLHFLYTGSIDLTPDNVHPVCVAAHFLQIATLLEPAVQHLCQLISAENALTLFEFSLNYQLERLRDSCLPFILKNNAAVFQDSTILKFSIKNFKELIDGLSELQWYSRAQFRVNTFDCIVRWTEVNLLERLDQLPGLLESIPLEELPYKFLTGTVSTHPLVKGSVSGSHSVSVAIEKYNFLYAFQSRQRLLVSGRDKKSLHKPLPFSFYDKLTDTWNKLPEMLVPRRDFACTIINGRDIVVSGGLTYKGVSLHSVEMFDWESQIWQRLEDLPIPRSVYSMTSFNDHLYAACAQLNNSFIIEKTCFYRYSFEAQQWIPLKPLNVARNKCQLIGYGDYIYALGGGSDIVEKYNPSTDQWSVLKQSSLNDRWIFGATVHQGKIYARLQHNELAVFDSETEVWDIVENDPDNPGTLSGNLVSNNGRLMALDGGGKNVVQFDFSHRKWRFFCQLERALGYPSLFSGEFY